MDLVKRFLESDMSDEEKAELVRSMTSLMSDLGWLEITTPEVLR